MLELVEGKVDESKVIIVGRLGAVAARSTAELSAGLSPGKYVLLCNIVERVPGAPVVSHYENGMYASLQVGE
jgi:hypothetical protein